MGFGQCGPHLRTSMYSAAFEHPVVQIRTHDLWEAPFRHAVSAVTIPGKGSDYGIAYVDSKKQPFDGSKTYKLNIPANPPVNNFWSVVLYDSQTRAQLQTSQRFPALDSVSGKFKKNTDGSIDLYFAPKAPKGMENNWLETIPGKGWFIALRMYGPLEPWIDKTWRPSEIELVK